MSSWSVEMLFMAGRAAALLFAFAIAAVAFTRWRRAAARDTESVITQLAALTERIETFSQRLAFLDARLIELSRQLETPAHTPVPAPAPAPTATPSYPIAIRLARNGATCEQIMESCGIGRQEAELVKRLHGPGKRSSRSQHAAA